MATRSLPAALAKRAHKTAEVAAARHEEEARDLIATVLEKKRMVSDAFWDMGSALFKLKDPRYIHALGHTSFGALLEKELSLSVTHATKLITVAQSFPRSDALTLGQERAAAVVELADARKELPAQLMRGPVTLPGHHERVRMTDLSARAIQRAAKVERMAHAPKKGRKAPGREGAKLAATLEKALRAAGIEEARVTETTLRKKGKGEQSVLRMQFAVGEVVAVGRILARVGK